jgi:hypothetical protein
MKALHKFLESPMESGIVEMRKMEEEEYTIFP